MKMGTSLTKDTQLAILDDRIRQVDVALFGFQSDYEVGEILGDEELKTQAKNNMLLLQKRKNAFIEIRKKYETKEEEKSSND